MSKRSAERLKHLQEATIHAKRSRKLMHKKPVLISQMPASCSLSCNLNFSTDEAKIVTKLGKGGGEWRL